MATILIFTNSLGFNFNSNYNPFVLHSYPLRANSSKLTNAGADFLLKIGRFWNDSFQTSMCIADTVSI